MFFAITYGDRQLLKIGLGSNQDFRYLEFQIDETDSVLDRANRRGLGSCCRLFMVRLSSMTLHVKAGWVRNFTVDLVRHIIQAIAISKENIHAS